MHLFQNVATRVQDPAERWELPVTPSQGEAWFTARRPSHPYTPRDHAEVPATAWDSLHRACGVDEVQQLFVIPWSIRATGWQDEAVMAPNSVLGLGRTGVALWTEKPEPGVKAAVALSEIAAIEDVTILLYGRLRFVSADSRLTIRYNAVARQELEPALLALRRRLAGPAQELPAQEQDPRGFPFKWKVCAGSDLVRLDKASPVVTRFDRVPARKKREAARGQLLALTPLELLCVGDPRDSTERYGFDTYVVPRGRITDAAATADGCQITSNGARIALPLSEDLAKAAVRWLCHS